AVGVSEGQGVARGSERYWAFDTARPLRANLRERFEAQGQEFRMCMGDRRRVNTWSSRSVIGLVIGASLACALASMPAAAQKKIIRSVPIGSLRSVHPT